MLSTESLPGPSCSCKAPALQSDERASDVQPATQEADPLGLDEIQTPTFSIRDYAFTSRSKDISKSWPFPKRFSQLCLKHGIQDLLPPFEPPDLVRSWLSKKDIGFGQSAASLEAEQSATLVDVLETEDVDPSDKELVGVKYDSCLPLSTLVANYSDQDQYPSKTKGKPRVDQVDHDKLINSENEIHSAVTGSDQSEKILNNIIEVPRSVHVSRSASEASSSELEGADPLLFENLEISQEPVEKKCKLIVKLSAFSEANRAEDISSNSSTVSDLMASKVCPVCKTFSSTSNTTLNAHIDQCLSVESNAKRAVVNVPKVKVKSRKKRLMGDIYATARQCTLEDLDRRNGTNWALEMTMLAANCTSESTLVAQSNMASIEAKKAKMSVVQSNEVSIEAKKPKMSLEDIRDDGDEGTVYVDSNGVKLRILSKLSGTTPFVSRKDFKLQKHTKNMKTNESSLISKKRPFGVNYPKHMKLKSHGKKSSFFKLSKGQIQASDDADYHVDNHQEKEVSEAQLVNASDQVKGTAYANLRQWVCSKRSDLPRKVNNKDIRKSTVMPVITTRSPLAESNEADEVDPPVGSSHAMKFSRLSEDLISHKTKTMDNLFSSTENVDNNCKNSPKPLASSSRWVSEGSSSGNNSLLLKLSRSMGSIISSPRSKREEIHHNVVIPSKSSQLSLKVKKSSTPKKNVLIERPSLMEAKKVDGSAKYTVLRKTRKHRTSLGADKGGSPSDANVKPLGSTNDTGLDGSRSNAKMWVHLSNISDSVVRSRTKKILDQSSPSSSKIQESNQEREGMQIELTACADVDTGCSMERAAHNTVNVEAVVPEKLKPASNAACSSMREHVEPICDTEILIEPVAPRVLDEKDIQYGDATQNQIVAQSIQIAGEIEFGWEENSSRYREADHHAVTVCIESSIAHSTSLEDEDHEIPQENSSVTSTGAVSCQDHKSIDRETSGSPVSSASNSSPPSPKDMKVEDSEATPSDRGTAFRDKLSSSLPNNLVLPSRVCIGKTEDTSIRINGQEAAAVPLPKETQQFVSQPCCCSRKDNFGRDPRFSRPSIIPATPIRPSISTSFNSSPSMRTDMLSIPNLDLHSKSTVSSDAAAKVPSFIDFSSPNPSPRTQTLLRLMGKNLMVSSEESVQLPAPSDSVNPLNARCFSPLGFTSTGSVLNQESYLYNQYHQLPRRSAVFGQVSLMPNHQMPLGVFSEDMHTGLSARPNQWIHPNKFSTKINQPSAYNMEAMAASYQHIENPTSSQAPYMRREVIVIDDSPEHEPEPRGSQMHPSTPLTPIFPASNVVPQRSFSCFPPHSQFLAREVFTGSTPSFPISCPRTNANSMMGGSTSEGSASLFPRPFQFSAPSTGHLASPLYYSQTLR